VIFFIIRLYRNSLAKSLLVCFLALFGYNFLYNLRLQGAKEYDIK